MLVMLHMLRVGAAIALVAFPLASFIAFVNGGISAALLPSFLTLLGLALAAVIGNAIGREQRKLHQLLLREAQDSTSHAVTVPLNWLNWLNWLATAVPLGGVSYLMVAYAWPAMWRSQGHDIGEYLILAFISYPIFVGFLNFFIKRGASCAQVALCA